MILAYLLLLTGLTISGVAIYYSVEGMIAIFSAAVIPITIMMTSLEIAKLVVASWLKAHWARVPTILKPYAIGAVVVLMFLTSMGIFGFLSKAHNDQNLVSGDVQSKIAIYDEKIKTAKENIESDRKQLKQMDEAVDQVMARSSDEKGADKSNAIRKSQQRDRANLSKDIEANQKIISQLNDEAAPIRAEVRKVEAEVGPLKYIAKFVYGDNVDENMLEKAVTWMIILIIFVFDPLAVIMLLAAQMTFAWAKEEKESNEYTPDPYVADVGDKPTAEEIYLEEDADLEPAPLEEAEIQEPRIDIDFEGVKDSDGNWIQTGPAFEYEVHPDEGAAEEPVHVPYIILDEESEADWPDAPVTTFTHEADKIVVHDAAGTMVIPLDENKLEEQLAEAVAEPEPVVEHHADGYVTIDGQVFHENAIPRHIKAKTEDRTYVQNEEQTESNKWMNVVNKATPVSESEYLSILEKKQQDGK